MTSKENKTLIAAIDFGTTFSGFAYQFKNSLESKPTDILANQKWDGDDQLSAKTITCILFNEKGTFDSFGYPAQKKYMRMSLRGKHKEWFYFFRFKMQLHDKKITRDMKIKAHNGQEMRAMTVFSESIKYMKNQLICQLEKQNTEVENHLIHWVLTVPAIWTDSAKQFMRESAEEAGINGDQLTIALEPESASLYCQVVTEEQTRQKQTSTDKNIASTGTKFMVIDLGGGTADITVQKRGENGRTIELHPATGGHLGGTRIDQEFENILIKIAGAPVMKQLENDNPLDHLDIVANFERSKRTFEPDTEEIYVTVPVKIEEYYKKQHGEDMETAIECSTYKGKIEWFRDKLILSADAMKDLFNTCSEKLVDLIKKLLEKTEVKGTDIFLMVGGFSESKIMQEAIKRKFPTAKIIIPPDPGLAVVKGAVLFGHRPISILSRKAKYTYGINISPAFDGTRHPESHKVTVNKMDRCRDVFKVYIRKGSTIETGKPEVGKHITLKPNQEEMLLNIFVSDNVEPKFVDEPDCDFAGRLVVKLPKTNEKIKVEVGIIFGSTEVTVEAEEQATHKKFKIYNRFNLEMTSCVCWDS